MATSATSYTIKKLITSIENKDYTVPQFQRGYVWDTRQAAALIDSIAKGYPFGAITVWKSKDIKLKSIGMLPASDKEDKNYVVDGQQRLTTLYLVWKNISSTKGRKKMYPDKIHVITDILDDDTEQFVVYENDLNGRNSVKLVDFLTLDSSEYREFESENELSRDVMAVLDKVKDMFGGCQVPLIEYDTDSLHMSVQVFERINQGGTKLDIFEIVNSITFEEGCKTLLEMYEEFTKMSEELNYYIQSKFWLQALVLAKGLGVGSKPTTSLAREHLIDIDNFNKAAVKAITFLKYEFGSIDSSILPYNHLFVLATNYYYKLNSSHVESPRDTKRLLNLLDHCCINEEFEKSTNQKLIKHEKNIKLILGDSDPVINNNLLDKSKLLNLGKFSRNSMWTSYVVTLMYRRGATSLKNNEKKLVDLTNIKSWLKDLHHIFPKDAYKGVNNIDHLLNIAPIPGSENKRIKNKKVPVYFEDETLASLKEEPAKTLSPLFIGEEMINHLKNENYEEFIDGRATEICNYINNKC